MHNSSYTSLSQSGKKTFSLFSSFILCVFLLFSTFNTALAADLKKPKNLLPRGNGDELQPEFSWEVTARATEYQLWIRQNGVQLLDERITSADLSCEAASSVRCTYSPSFSLLLNKTARWKVRAFNTSERSKWSNTKQYQVKTPAAPKTKKPKNTINESKPVYSWKAVQSANDYELVLHRGGTVLFTGSVSAEEAGCSDSNNTCTFTPDAPLDNGNYKWRVRGIFDVGNGKWSGFRSFKVRNVVVTENQPPVADAQSVSVDEDGTVNITLTGSDADGDELTFNVVNQPGSGGLTGTAPNLTYVPTGDYFGTDSFTFTVNDGTVDSAEVTVDITVNSVNDLPTANAGDDESVNEGTRVSLSGFGSSDVEGIANYSWVQLSGPEVELTGASGPIVTFDAPEIDASDSPVTIVIELTVTDDDGASATDQVSVLVTDENRPPSASSQSVLAEGNSDVVIQLSGTDPDDDPLTYALVDGVSNGTLSAISSTNTVTYTPNPGFVGVDSFTFKVNDGAVDSTAATITITTDEPAQGGVRFRIDWDADENRYRAYLRPSATPFPDLTLSGQVTIRVPHVADNGAFDVAGILGAHAPGAEWELTTVTRSPAENPGYDYLSFTITLSSPNALSLQGGLEEEIFSFRNSRSCVVGAGGVTIMDNATDPFNAPGGNSAFTNQGNEFSSLVWTSVNDFLGVYGTAADCSASAATNTPPTATDNAFSTNEDASVAITLNGDDADGDVLEFLITDPANGTLSGTAPELTYTPDADFSGTDSFSYRVSDGIASSNTVTVTLTVNGVNDAPTADAGNDQAVDEGSTVNLSGSGSDPDGDELSYSWVQVSGPDVSLSDAGTATASFTAPDVTGEQVVVLELTVSDGNGGSATDQVSVTASSVNTAPTATAQTVSVDEDDSVVITLSGEDAENDALTFSVVTQPSNGSLSGTAPNLTYTPTADFSGADSFTFKANDGTADSTPATVEITVNAVNILPTAEAGDQQEVYETQQVTLSGSGADEDGSIAGYSWAQTGGTSVGFSGASTADVTLNTAEVTADEVLTFTLTVTDDAGATATDTMTVLVKNLVIEDEQLAACIGTTSPQVILNQSYLACRNGAVDDTTDFSELSKMVGLRTLDLYNNQIADVTPLAGLTALTSLRLGNNQIENVTPLDGLTALTSLYLSSNKIVDVTPLDGLTALTYLGLSNNEIVDVTPLSNLAALTRLDLVGNQIENVTPLDGLTALTSLRLSSNKIVDVTPLDGLTALTSLGLSNNEIVDVTPLDGLTALTSLSLGGNQIENITPLDGLTALTSLSLFNNKVEGVAPLAGLTALTFLQLSSNQIGDVMPLAGLTALTRLHLDNNQIADVTPLASLTPLTQLWLQSNLLVDISPLINLSNLEFFPVFGNCILDFSGFDANVLQGEENQRPIEQCTITG